MAARSGAKVERVVAPLVQVKVANRILHFYRGDVLPEGVDKESLENLRGLGFVASEDADDTDSSASK